MEKNMDSEDEAELYKRHNTLGLSIPQSISIVGCGGTGTWAAIMAAMGGVKSITLFDSDIVELHNLSRLPFDFEDTVGHKKTEVLSKFLKRMRPGMTVITYDGIYNDTDLFRLIDEVVFDCNDDYKTQMKIYKYCKDNNISYIGIGCNADHISIKSKIDKLWGTGETNRYQVVPMFFIPPILAASCTLWHIVRRNSRNIDVLQPIKYMFIEPSSGVRPSGCNECPNVENCTGCVLHGMEAYNQCSCCPIITS